MSGPISLTDAQLEAVYRGASPVHPAQRDAFLQRVADGLAGCPSPGDGDVFRAVREAQAATLNPPLHARDGRRGPR